MAYPSTTLPTPIYPIGREQDIEAIRAKVKRGGHLLIQGPRGIGKETIIRFLHSTHDGPAVLIPQGQSKPQLLAVAHQLHTLAGLVMPADMLPDTTVARARKHGRLNWEDVNRALYRTTTQKLADIVVNTLGTRQMRVVVYIESLDMPPQQAGVLGRLFDVAQVVAARGDYNQRTRILKLLWLFGQKVVLKPLPLDACMKIAEAATAAHGVRFADLQTRGRFVRHIARESRGVPAAIVGMVAEAAGMTTVTPAKVAGITHDAGALYLDMTPLFIIGLIIAMAMRYISRGIGEAELMVIAGVAGTLFMGVRILMSFMRR